MTVKMLYRACCNGCADMTMPHASKAALQNWLDNLGRWATFKTGARYSHYCPRCKDKAPR